VSQLTQNIMNLRQEVARYRHMLTATREESESLTLFSCFGNCSVLYNKLRNVKVVEIIIYIKSRLATTSKLAFSIVTLRFITNCS